MTEEVRFSVVTLAWQNEQYARPFAKSLVDSIGVRKDVEIICVVNGAAGDSATTILQAAIPGLQVVRLDDNEGFSGGMNRGAELTNGSVVILANLDITFGPRFFETIDDSASGWDLLVPDVRQPLNGLVTHAGAMMRTFLLRTRPEAKQPATGSLVAAGNGACIIATKAFIGRRNDANGMLFDYELGSFNEDIDLFWWADRTAAVIRYESEVGVEHALGGSFGGQYAFAERPATIQRQVMRNYRIVAWKNCVSPKEWCGWVLGDLSYLAQVVKADGPERGFRLYAQSWVAAINCVRKIRRRRGSLRIFG